MDTTYADAVVALDEAVARACEDAAEHLTHKEIAAELRRAADAWEEYANP